MRKLKLDLEQLEVTSFDTAEESRSRGTVLGHKLPPPTEWHCEDTYVGYWTCDYTCANSCQNGGCMTQPTWECGGCQP